MIEVKVNYIQLPSVTKIKIIRDFVVTGHANDGTLASIKCCAGVTACVLGVARIITNASENFILDKGNFLYHCEDTSINEVNGDVQFALQTLLSQLVEIDKIYPQFLKIYLVDNGDYKDGKNQQSNNTNN